MRRRKPETLTPSPASAGEGGGEGPSPLPLAGEVAQRASEGPEGLVKRARVAGYALLAGRDFSQHELATRLLRKGHPREAVDAAVAALVAEGLLRDSRYAEQFVRQHARKGRGPVRIRTELRERGTDPEAAATALEQSEEDWVRLARETRRRKFGQSLPGDARERAKQARFLQYRGFSSDQIRAALGPDEDDPDP